MSDAEAQPEQPARDESASGLRRAMEHRMASLQEAEERLQREQSALQEQAKVVFAEREARLDRREQALVERERDLAAAAMSPTPAGAAPLDDARAQALEEAVTTLER